MEETPRKSFIYRENPKEEGRETLQTHSARPPVELPDASVEPAEVSQDEPAEEELSLGEADEAG